MDWLNFSQRQPETWYQCNITDDNKIRLNFHVIVAYGVNISTIADNLVSNVKYKVEDFTGMEIEKINIMLKAYAL